MARRIPCRVNRTQKHKLGNVYKSDYDLGWDLWYTGKPLPMGATRNTQQGYVNAAKSQDKCILVSMKAAARKGLFVFLAKHEALIGPDSVKPLSWGHTGRYPVRKARAECASVRAMAPSLH